MTHCVILHIQTLVCMFLQDGYCNTSVLSHFGTKMNKTMIQMYHGHLCLWSWTALLLLQASGKKHWEIYKNKNPSVQLS